MSCLGKAIVTKMHVPHAAIPNKVQLKGPTTFQTEPPPPKAAAQSLCMLRSFASIKIHSATLVSLEVRSMQLLLTGQNNCGQLHGVPSLCVHTWNEVSHSVWLTIGSSVIVCRYCDRLSASAAWLMEANLSNLVWFPSTGNWRPP
jgi:hypothetical protein